MEKILATVGGLNITESDVNEFLANLGQRGQGYNTAEGKKMILEQLAGQSAGMPEQGIQQNMPINQMPM